MPDNCNMIEFNRLECLRAEAIFGDTIRIVFAGEQIWEGPVDTNRGYPIRQSRVIPQGQGARIDIYQFYFGQPIQLVYSSENVRRVDEQGERTHRVNADDDGDPGGEYILYVALRRDSVNELRRGVPLPPERRR